MADTQSAPTDSAPAAPGEAANTPPLPQSTWGIIRPFVGGAAFIILVALPPFGAIEVTALCLAGLALLACLIPPKAADGPEALRPPWPGRLLLLLGGIAAVLGPLLYANPTRWSVGVTEWLWTYWLRAQRWTPRLDVLCLVAAGVLAIVGATRRRRGLLLPAAVLALMTLVAARGHASKSPISLVSLSHVNLLWTVSAAAFGGGLVHLASRSPERRGLARALVAAGAIGIACVYPAWFPEQGEEIKSSLGFWADELPVLFGVIFKSAELDPMHAEAMRQQFYGVGLPFLFQLAAIVLGLVVAVTPSRRRGRGLRWMALVAWLLLLSTWVLPPRVGAWYQRTEIAALGASRVVALVSETLMRAGLAIWIVASGAVASLLSLPPPPAAAALPQAAPARDTGRWAAALYLFAAALSLLVLRASFDAERGTVIALPIEEVARAARWAKPVASLVFQAGFTLGMLVCAFLPAGRARGFVGALAAGLAIGALTPTGPDYPTFGGVEWWVPPVLGVLAAGLSLPPRPPATSSRGRRTAAVVTALLALALLLYPIRVDPVRIPGTPDVTLPYRTVLFDEMIGRLMSDSSLEGVLGVLASGGLLAFSLAATAVLAIAAVLRRSRALAVAAIVVMGGGGLVGHALLIAFGFAGGAGGAGLLTVPRFVDTLWALEPGGGGGFATLLRMPAVALAVLPDWIWRLGWALQALVVPYVLGLLAAVLDSGASARRAGSAPAKELELAA